MRLHNFMRLLWTIFRAPQPDLAWIQRQGLLAVKLGQIFALRPDFLGAERCRTLAMLYSNAETLPAESALPLVTSYAGSEYLEHFESFHTQAFASASIGQVHRALLKSGEVVAVKIVKRDYAESFRRDAVSVQRFFRWAIRFYPRLRGVANPVSLLEQISRMTLRELDLRNEVEGNRILEHIQAEHSSRYDLSQLQFRRIYEELSGERILVSEFVEGQTLDALIRAGQLSYASLLQLFRLHGYFLFAVGIFHGDIHPGNIILRDNSFVFLDTGYIGRATTKMRRNLFYFFAALCQDDYAAAATSLNAMAEQPIEGARYAAFQRKFLELYREFPGKTVSEVSLTQKMMQTIRLGVDSGMHFDEGMFDIIRSLMFLDGMVLRVNPQAVLLRDMREFVESFAVYVG